jgi:hypothetical protein
MPYPSRYVPEIREAESDCNPVIRAQPGKLWSLRDMINYKLVSFYWIIRMILEEGGRHKASPSEEIGDDLRARINDLLLLVEGEASEWSLDATTHRLYLVKLRLPGFQRKSNLIQELKILLEAIEGGEVLILLGIWRGASFA